MEPEFYRMAPRGVTTHTARMRLDQVTLKGLIRMAEEAERAAELLMTADMDVIVYGCTTGSLVGGVKWEERLVNKIQEITEVPTISTSRAVVDALHTLGGGKIGVATPYTDDLNKLEKDFLESHGLEISSLSGLGLVSNLGIGQTPGDIVEGLVGLVSEGSELIFVSCTNLPAVDLIERLEGELEMHVVTSNQASLWAALQGFDVEEIKGFGKLLRDQL